MLSKLNCTTCKPLECLDDVLNWSVDDAKRRPYKVRDLATRSRLESSEKQVKIILCHDMKNNYLEDKYYQGALSLTSVAYRFYNWSLIEYFIYFSHHFITIPPESWINASHANRVPILATLITEWKPGYDLCDKLLSDRRLTEAFVTKLVDLTVFYGFDGWLLNIENPIRPEMVENLVFMVKLLVSSLRTIDIRYKVIWYDSVIETGELKWQNELNGLNECFFDQVDAIFINYTWKEENLANSYVNAKHRVNDVYIGVDCFGRNCFGGGGFNCNLAFDEILKAKLNVALFAPGWVLECNSDKEFVENERKFWSLLESYAVKVKLNELPLVSTFNQGCGEKFFINGQCFSENSSWYNLNLQSLQPAMPLNWCFDDAYYGGSCVEVSKSSCTSLFDTDVQIDANQVIRVKYVFKEDVDDAGVNVYALLKYSHGGLYKLVEDSVSSDFELERYSQKLISTNWIVRELALRPLRAIKLTGLGLVNNSSSDIKLGFVSVVPSSDLTPSTSPISDLTVKHSTCLRLENRHFYCLKIEWNLEQDEKEEQSSRGGYYNLFLNNNNTTYRYVGSSTIEKFYLCLEIENYYFNYSIVSDKSREENKISKLLVQYVSSIGESLTSSNTLDIEIPGRASVKNILHDFEFIF